MSRRLFGPPARRGHSHRESGLTFIELLIAVALLGFILLGIVPLFLSSVKSNYSANQYTSIHNIARDKLEQLMNLPFTDAQLSAGNHGDDLPPTMPDPWTGVPPAPATAGAVPNPFEVTYEVKQYQIPPDSGLGSPASGAPYIPIEITAAGERVEYKRIDVTVEATGGVLGIGSRRAKVSGVLSNPSVPTILSDLVVPPLTPTP